MILDRIVARTRERIAGLPLLLPENGSAARRSLKGAIESARERNAVIAELKYASPSRGVLESGIHPGTLAEELAAGGCVALSVLTEPYFFGGSTENIGHVRRVSGLPILRKDFIIDERQLYETKALSADAVLLIAGVLKSDLPAFVQTAYEIGLEPLVEVHSRNEAEQALRTDAELIGINNRNLTTMTIDLNTTKRLSGMIRQEGRMVVSESGILWPFDVRNLRDSCDAFLIGSAVMSAENRKKRLEGLVYA